MRANTVNEHGQMYTHLNTCNTHLKDCEASVKPIEVTLMRRHYLGSEKKLVPVLVGGLWPYHVSSF